MQRYYWLPLSLSQSPKSAPHHHQPAVSSTCFRGSCREPRKRGLWYLTCYHFKTTKAPETEITASWETILKKYPCVLILLLHCSPETHCWLVSDTGLKRPSEGLTMDILISITNVGILNNIYSCG